MAKKKSKKRSKKLKLMGGPMALPRELEQSLLAALAGQQQQGSKSITATNTSKTSSDESKPKVSKKAQQDPILIRQKLQDAVDRKIRKNDILRGRMESLDIKKAALAIRIMEEKKKKGPQGGVKATYEQHCKIQQKYRVLSGVLDRLLVRCSKAGHVNDCLINEINEKRKERMIFEQMQARLKRKFHEKQRQMAKLLQLSNEFNESRLKARKDLETLIEEEEKEKKREEEEYDRLDEVIRRQENLQNDLQTASLKRRAHQLKEQIGSGTLDPEEEARLRARLSALNAKIERKSNEIEVVQTDTMWSYEEAFQQILDEASTESHSPTLAEVVTQFVQNYDESFGLLNYVQLIQDENYKIEARLATVRADFQKYAREQGKHDMNKERIKNELNSRLENLNMNNGKLQAALEQKEATLSLLVQSIERLARQFNGHGIITQEKEIGSETSTRSLMHCLGQIELKTIEMCQHLERSILAEQHEEEKQRSKLSGLDGNNAKSRNVLLLTKESTTHSAGLYGGPQSPVRSRKEATVKIPRFGKDTVKAVFDSRNEHSGNILDGPEQEDDMRVISIDELRSMAQATLVKPTSSAKHRE